MAFLKVTYFFTFKQGYNLRQKGKLATTRYAALEMAKQNTCSVFTRVLHKQLLSPYTPCGTCPAGIQTF